MILSFQSIIHSIANVCGAVATFLGELCVGLIFVLFFVAFAIGEGLGMGKID